jgi:hypothetical protein
MCGVSSAAVRKAVREGKIPVVPIEGTKYMKIDRTHPDAIAYQYTDRSAHQAMCIKAAASRRKPKKLGRPRGKTKKKVIIPSDELPLAPIVLPKKKEEKQKIKYQKVLQQKDFPDDQPIVVNSANVNMIKLYEAIRQSRVKTAKEQGSLVSRDRIIQLFAKLYTVDANEWKTLPANAASEIAAVCGQEDKDTTLRIEQILEQKVYAILRHIQRMMLSYVDEVEADPDFDLDDV